MTVPPPGVRARNAAATRAAILAAARVRFSHDSYDNVGVRDIASDAGVDAALVSRYFGSKEELFAEVLSCGGKPSELLEAGREGLAARAAGLLLEEPKDGKLEDLMIMLESASSPRAGDLVRQSIRERFHGPVAQIIGGENAELRARLFGSVLMGLAIARSLNGDYEADLATRERLTARLTELLQHALQPL